MTTPSQLIRCAATLGAAILSVALFSGCKEASRPSYQFDAGPRDSATRDVDTPVDSGDPEETCSIGDPLTLGPVETNAANVELDRAHVIARPGESAEFLALTARSICPTVCDGSDPDEGPENFAMRRALLYPVPGSEGEGPSEPVIVNLGTGLTGNTLTVAPAMTPVDGRLVVAWLDTALSEARNVWAQSLDLATLEPSGTMLKVSGVESPDGVSRLEIVSGTSEAIVIYDTIDPPTRRRATISADGEPLTDAYLEDVPDGPGHLGLLRSSAGQVIRAHTEWTTKPYCDLLIGVEGGAATALQEDAVARVCGPFAIAEGAATYGAIAAGVDVLLHRPISSSGVPLGFERTIAGSPGRAAELPAMSPFRGGHVVAYVERSSGGGALRAAFVTLQGDVTLDVELVDVPAHVSQPSLAVSNDGSTIAVAWQERGPEGDATKLLRLHCE